MNDERPICHVVAGASAVSPRRRLSRLRTIAAWILVVGLSGLLFAMLRWPSVRYGVARRLQFFRRHSVASRVEAIRAAKPSLAELAATSGGTLDILVF